MVLADDVLEPLRAVAAGDDRVGRRRGWRRCAGTTGSEPPPEPRPEPAPVDQDALLTWDVRPLWRAPSCRSMTRMTISPDPIRLALASTTVVSAAGRAGSRRIGPPASRSRLSRRGRGEPGRFSQAHEGVAYGCCVPALTRFTNPHCPGPPRLTLTPAARARAGNPVIVMDRSTRYKWAVGSRHEKGISPITVGHAERI